jgi:hypothetical protein
MTSLVRTIGAAIGIVFVMSTIAVGQHGRGPSPHVTGKPANTPTVPPSTSGPTTASPIAAKIESHPQLAAKLTPLIPKGMTLDTAAAGFKNQGQFIAALHVSHNLGIPFASLKADMTGDHAKSLGQAIHHLRPSADASSAKKKAEKQASEDVQASDR